MADTPPSGLKRDDWIAGLEKGLRVIEAFNDAHPRLTASTAARRTGVTRTAARRHLLTLQHLGYVESDGQLFWLTPKVLRLGWSYFDSAKLPRAAQPHLQRIGLALNSTAFLAVQDEDDIVFVARSGSSQIQNVGFVLGARLSANLVAAGIAMLACRSPQAIDRWLQDRKFVAYTPYTAVTAEAVRSHIDHARSHGYAMLEQQLALAVRGVAVPIRRPGGELLGAISVSLPMEGESAERAVARALPLLREAEYALISTL